MKIPLILPDIKPEGFHGVVVLNSRNGSFLKIHSWTLCDCVNIGGLAMEHIMKSSQSEAIQKFVWDITFYQVTNCLAI